jgi:signal transduction histidine kinase
MIPGKDSTSHLIVAVLATVMAAFVLTSLVAQRTSGTVASLSDQIVSISAPSMERMASIRSVVFEVQLVLSESLRDGPRAAERLARLDTPLKTLNEDVRGYLTLPIFQDEGSYWREIQSALARFDDGVQRASDLIRSGAITDAQAELTRGVEPSGRQLIQAALGAIEFHARNSRAMAAKMSAASRRANRVTNISSGLCVAFGIAGLLLIRRQSRKHDALVQEHSAFQETRANEYELFAGRVAHDIKNPLSAAHMAAHLALRRADDDAQRATIERILRALSRADAITTALLEFARSGGQPDPGARTDAGPVLEDFVRGLGPELEALRIDFQLEPIPPVLIACSSGVYLALIGNLVRNATKYMGQSDPRRVTVRVTDEGTCVRTEVIDTGPGISAEDQPSLFVPYFRVRQDRAKEGLGLGLATVKRLAEGHGGSVGVSSEPGKGSTFWFRLPRAGTATPSIPPVEPALEKEVHSPEARH